MSFLKTSRLVLRQFTDNDVDAMFEINSDPDVMLYLNGGVPHTRQHVATVVMPWLAERDERWPGLGRWAVVERSSGTVVGWSGLSPHPRLDPPRAAVLGYRFKKTAWGRGYATESSRALLTKGFSDLGTELVTADTLAINKASRRVMEKLGMTHQRTFHTPWEGPAEPLEGFELGEVEYKITKAQWVQQAQIQP
jgi:RimJ/RimL family protein N-acetyltransferase